MNFAVIEHLTRLVLANGNGEIAGAIFALLFALLHIINAMKKKQEQRKPTIIPREGQAQGGRQNQPARSMRRTPVPAPRPQRSNQAPAPVVRRSPTAQPPRRPAPPPVPGQRRMPPIAFPPTRPVAAPVPVAPKVLAAPPVQSVSSVVAAPVAPAASRPQTALAASVHRWLTPQTLRSQYILTEVFQPPLGLREF